MPIRALEYLPYVSQWYLSHNVQIPVIDITESTDAVGDALLDAVKTYGFVFIKNLGLDFKPQEVKRTFELASLALAYDSI
ncbi:MAG: hypothetical protein M1827_001480 [Pycnora praestabilis]|nr:MAG: hypothetical protein M1827_001480 [Pycnora praestabilis]